MNRTYSLNYPLVGISRGKCTRLSFRLIFSQLFDEITAAHDPEYAINVDIFYKNGFLQSLRSVERVLNH